MLLSIWEECTEQFDKFLINFSEELLKEHNNKSNSFTQQRDYSFEIQRGKETQLGTKISLQSVYKEDYEKLFEIDPEFEKVSSMLFCLSLKAKTPKIAELLEGELTSLSFEIFKSTFYKTYISKIPLFIARKDANINLYAYDQCKKFNEFLIKINNNILLFQSIKIILGFAHKIKDIFTYTFEEFINAFLAYFISITNTYFIHS